MLKNLTPSSQSASGWSPYWNQAMTWASPKIYELNAKIFHEGIQKEIPLETHHRILNIGCGPGYLERRLSKSVHSVIGTDPSPAMIHRARENGRGLANVQFLQMSADQIPGSPLVTGKFHYFFCISVAQYFSNHSLLLDLIRDLSSVACPGAKLILADLPQSDNKLSFLTESAAMLLQALRGRYAHTLSIEIATHLSDYQAYQNQLKTSGQLLWSQTQLSQLLSKSSVRWRMIQQPLSICPTRLNILIEL